jgi:hypothetical protein
LGCTRHTVHSIYNEFHPVSADDDVKIALIPLQQAKRDKGWGNSQEY